MSAKNNHAAKSLATMITGMVKRMDDMDMRIANSQITGRVAEVNGNRVRVVMDEQGANGQSVLSPWVQLQEAAGATGTNMPVKVGDPLRIFSINGEIGNGSLAVRDSHTDDAQNPARTSEELVMSYGGGAVRMNKNEVTITYNDNSITLDAAGMLIKHAGNIIRMNSDGLFMMNGGAGIELKSGIMRLLSSKVFHNQKNIGDDHVHTGVKSGGDVSSIPA